MVLFGAQAGGAAIWGVAADKEQQFLQAMGPLRQSRLRTGAIDWALYQDSQNPRLFIELFSVASWEEHLRQHRERQTATDLQYHDEAAALSDSPPQPATTWPRTSMSSESPAHSAQSSDGSASRVTATDVVSFCPRQAAPSCSGAGGAGWVHPPGGCRGRFPARVRGL
jgi:hypothetical protein